MPTVLVTGGAGFIGRHVVSRFLQQNWNVVVFDLEPLTATEASLNERCTFIQGNITSRQAIDEAMRTCDAVVHLAALVSVPLSIKAPETTQSVNVIGTRNVLECAIENDIGSVIVASSAAVYGACPDLPLNESAALQCLSPYAESKRSNEDDIVAFREKGLNAMALRFFNIYGPGQKADSPYASLIPRFVQAMGAGKAPTVHGDGKQTRDFVHVTDLARAVVDLIVQPEPYEHAIANVASQTQTSVLDVVNSINRFRMDVKGLEPISPRYGASRQGDIKHSCGAFERLHGMIEWSPEISFQDGITSLLAEDGMR